MLIQCCVCKSVQRDDNWEAAATHHHDASHTYCPKCAKAARAEIAAFKRGYLAQRARQVAVGSLQDLFQKQEPLRRLNTDGTA